MSCNYKYKGVEYTNQSDLLRVISQEMAEGSITTQTSPNKMVYEVNGLIGKAAAINLARQDYGTSEFLSFFEEGGKTYMYINEQLLQDLTGPMRLVFDKNNNLVEVDINKEVDKYKKGELSPDKITPSLYDAIQKRIAHMILDYSKGALTTRGQAPQEDLLARLMDFASKLGITVTTIEDYIENYEQRKGVPTNAEALADMMNQVIALADGKDVDNLTEEVSHFAIEYYKNQDIINRMLQSVDQTSAYKRYAAQYRAEYSKDLSGDALEMKVRKEVLGKLLAEQISRNFNTENVTSGVERGIITRLSELFQKFLNLFKQTDQNKDFFREFGKTIDDIANDVTGLSMGMTKFAPYESKEVYYSLTGEQKSLKEGLQSILKQLTAKYKSIANDQRGAIKVRDIRLNAIAKEIQNLSFIEATQGFLAVLNQDLKEAQTIINDAKNSLEDLLRDKEARLGDKYVTPSGREKNRLLVDSITDINLQNLIVFTENIDNLIAQLEGNLDLLSETREGVTGAHIDSIRKQLQTAKSTRDAVMPILQDLKKAKTIQLIRSTLRDLGFRESVINNEVSTLIQNKMEDIFWLTSKFFGVGSFDNPIVNIVYALVRLANATVSERTRQFRNRFHKKIRELNLTDALVRKLNKAGYMIDSVDRRAAKAAYKAASDKLNEEFENELSKLDPNSIDFDREVNRLRYEYDLKKDELNIEWFEPMFTTNFNERLRVRTEGSLNPVSNSKYRSPEAQVFIKARAATISRILNKYRDPKTGIVDYTRITVEDRNLLHSEEVRKRKWMSEYNEDGSVKTSQELMIAHDLMDYYQVSGDMEISEEAQKLFERESVVAKRNLSSGDYQKWLNSVSYLSYPKGVLDDGSLERVIAEEETAANVRANPDLYQALLAEIYLPGITGEPTYQQLYDALISKRNQLFKPYKKAGDSSNIDGAAVEDNPELLLALSKIEDMLRLFSFEGAQEARFRAEPNEAFIRKYDKLKAEGGLDTWVAKHSSGQTVRINGNVYPVPKRSSRYYLRYELLDEEGRVVPRERVASFYWEMQVQNAREVNPKFDQSMAGKAEQYSEAKKAEFRNQEYFDLFAPDENGVPTRNIDLFKLRQFLLSEKAAMDAKIPNLYNSYYMLPQVLPHGAEGLTSKKKAWSIFTGRFLRHSADEDYNMDELGGTFNGESRNIPLHYHVEHPDPEQLSGDISYMFGQYALMAYNYQEKSKILVDLLVLKNTLANSLFPGEGKGEGTRIYKAMNEFMSAHVYGNKFLEIKIGDKEGKPGSISPTKVVNFIYDSTVLKNLGLNIYVPTVGAISGVITRRTMAAEGEYFTDESIMEGNKQLVEGFALLKTLGDTGLLDPKSYLGKLDYFSGTREVQHDYFKGSFDNNPALRALKKSNPMFDLVGYTMFGKISALLTTISVYDNFRLVDGQFISYKNFEERMMEDNSELTREEVKTKWAAYKNKSFNNFIVETETTLEIDRAKLRKEGFEGDIARLKARMDIVTRTAHEKVEMTANNEDKALSARHPLARLFLWIHKSFFQRYIERAFKVRQLDMASGSTVEGTYTSFARMFKTAWANREFRELGQLMGGLLIHTENHEKVMKKMGLDSVDQGNMRRMRRDIYAYAATFAAMILLNLWADDDDKEDDFLLQYSAYVASRVFNETASVQLPSGVNELLKMFQSPSAGVSVLETLWEIPSLLFNATDTVQSGAYEGMLKGWKALLKLLPTKNIYEPFYGNPKKSNMYFRINALPTFPNSIYKYINEKVYEEDNELIY